MGSENGIGKRNRFCQHLRRLFLPGTLKKLPAVSMSYWPILERNLVGLADLKGSKLHRMANWPSQIETGPVGHPLNFEPAISADRNWASWPSIGISAKSANSTDSSRKLNNSSLGQLKSKLGQLAIRWNFEPEKSANPTRFLSKIDQ